MRRRQFLQLAGSGAFAVRPLTALAQNDTSLPLVAMLVPGGAEFARRRVEALRAGIKEAGLVEGVNYAFTVRFADGDFARLPWLAKELDALKPRVFVASGAAVRTMHEVLPDAPGVHVVCGRPGLVRAGAEL